MAPEPLPVRPLSEREQLDQEVSRKAQRLLDAQRALNLGDAMRRVFKAEPGLFAKWLGAAAGVSAEGVRD